MAWLNVAAEYIGGRGEEVCGRPTGKNMGRLGS